jgi:hypothetical protein
VCWLRTRLVRRRTYPLVRKRRLMPGASIRSPAVLIRIPAYLESVPFRLLHSYTEGLTRAPAPHKKRFFADFRGDRLRTGWSRLWIQPVTRSLCQDHQQSEPATSKTIDMSIDQTDIVDFVSIDQGTDALMLTISDHLPWGDEEGPHLQLLQSKLNACLRFIESGELVAKYPEALGRDIVVNIVARYPPSSKATMFLEHADTAIQAAGFHFKFSVGSAHA